MDEWLGGRKGKWGWLLERAGWRAGRALLGTRRHGSACFEPSPPPATTQDKVEASREVHFVHPCAPFFAVQKCALSVHL